MSCDCDYERPEFFRQAKHKAVKQHRCSECRSVILPGETYELNSGKWDGRFEAYKMCPRCAAVRDHIQAHVPCFCWAFGHLLQDVSYTLDGMLPSIRGSGLLFEIGRMVVAIRRHRQFYKIQQGA